MAEIRAEFHCHTHYSDGFASPQTCIRHAARKGLQVLALTDHNTAEGALRYWKQPLQQGVLVIPGEEVSTDVGHVLALFVHASITPGPFETVLRHIREQEALAFIAHPYHIPLGNLWRRHRILKASPEQLCLPDGIEVINGHNRTPANRLAQALARTYRLCPIAGSDAHFPWEIGNASTYLQVSELTYDAVRQALFKHHTQPQARQFNAYPVYLLVGLLNRVRKQKYAWKPIPESQK